MAGKEKPYGRELQGLCGPRPLRTVFPVDLAQVSPLIVPAWVLWSLIQRPRNRMGAGLQGWWEGPYNWGSIWGVRESPRDKGVRQGKCPHFCLMLRSTHCPLLSHINAYCFCLLSFPLPASIGLSLSPFISAVPPSSSPESHIICFQEAFNKPIPGPVPSTAFLNKPRLLGLHQAFLLLQLLLALLAHLTTRPPPPIL